MQIDYGRLNALEAALGGRAAVQTAYKENRRLVSGISLIEFPFAFDTPGLVDGVDVYTPKIGDRLLEAWIEVDEAWNGITPFGDLGQYLPDSNYAPQGFGFGDWIGSTYRSDMTAPWGAGGVDDNIPGSINTSNGPGAGNRDMPPGGIGYYYKGARFITDDPMKVVVSRDGSAPGGGDPGATQGRGIVVLVIASRP